MEYAILGNAAFFAVAFAMQMGWLSWDMLGFGQDDDDDVAVKNPDPDQIPKTRKTPITPRLIMPLSRWEHQEMIPRHVTSTESVALFGLTGNDSLVAALLMITSKGTQATIRSMPLAE